MRNFFSQLVEEKKHKISGGIYHFIQVNFTYNSNRIEGSTLSEEETRYIFETNTIGIESKTLKVDDIIETTNHFKCIDYVLDNFQLNLNHDFIKKLHLILFQSTSKSDLDWFNVGDYKLLDNMVGETKTSLVSEVYDDLSNLFDKYSKKGLITVNDVIDFHYRFEKIHPFQDGNGRVGRLIILKECLKNNIVPFFIDDSYKYFYYRGLKEYTSDDVFLIDTCLSAQVKFKEILKGFGY